MGQGFSLTYQCTPQWTTKTPWHITLSVLYHVQPQLPEHLYILISAMLHLVSACTPVTKVSPLTDF